METHLNRYRQTVKLGLIKTIHDLFPEEDLKAAYSILDGVFCNLVDSAMSAREVKQLNRMLQEWVNQDCPIELLEHTEGYYHYRVDGMIIKSVYPANSRSSFIEPFRLIPFSSGFIVDFSTTEEHNQTLILPEKLSAAYDRRQQWLRNIHMELVPDVNSYISSGNTIELINISEALQEKEISIIADEILHERRSIRIILISGPSSSGKTTFAQRLSTQLRVNGLRPIPLSLDNYFLNRDQTPLDQDGKHDYESIDALDIKLLQQQIIQLIHGHAVETPIFDFISGSRKKETIPMQLGECDILLVEGIHALNPKLLPDINRNILFKIYLSALFELNIDLTNRVSATDVRFIRRLIRGNLFRGSSAEHTMDSWPSVRKAETEKIFVFAEEADVMFNSSLLYEVNAQKPFAEELLNQIEDGSPYQPVRDRFLSLLSFFQTMDTSKIPLNSIIREFIGGSVYFTQE